MTVDEIRNEVRSLPTGALRAEFADGLRVTAERLTRLAAVLAELEARGERVAGCPPGLLSLLRRIAAGELLPEVVVTFAAAPAALRQAAARPVGEQRRLVEDESAAAELLRPKLRRARGRAGAARTREEGGWKIPVVAASLAAPRDLAELIAEMIAANQEPEAVWDILLREYPGGPTKRRPGLAAV